MIISVREYYLKIVKQTPHTVIINSHFQLYLKAKGNIVFMQSTPSFQCLNTSKRGESSKLGIHKFLFLAKLQKMEPA